MLEIRHKGVEDSSDAMEAYESIYQNEGIVLRDSFYLWLLELLNPRKGKTLLDISCGEGRLTAFASEMGLQTIGIDFSIKALVIAQEHLGPIGWSVGNGERLPIGENSCDYVANIGSLEHYEHPDLGVQEIARVLKPGGIACILLPNAFGLLGNIRYVLRTGEIFDDGLQPIQRYATRMTWTRLLEDNGLKVQKTVGYGEVERPRTATDRGWIIRRPHKIIKLAFSSLIPLNLKNHLVFLCTVA